MVVVLLAVLALFVDGCSSVEFCAARFDARAQEHRYLRNLGFGICLEFDYFYIHSLINYSLFRLLLFSFLISFQLLSSYFNKRFHKR